MIARIWRGWAPQGRASDYQRHYDTEVSGHLREVSGFRGAQLPRRDEHGEVAFTSITWFTDLDAVRAFAGDDYERAVVEQPARAALGRWDERVIHDEVAIHVQERANWQIRRSVLVCRNRSRARRAARSGGYLKSCFDEGGVAGDANRAGREHRGGGSAPHRLGRHLGHGTLVPLSGQHIRAAAVVRHIVTLLTGRGKFGTGPSECRPPGRR
jgi:heme-degrading monooxygenase HmoA